MNLNLKTIGSCILGVSILFSQTLWGDSVIFAAEKKRDYIKETSFRTNNILDYSNNSSLTKEYEDEQYPFTLKIPTIWMDHMYVNRDQFDEVAKGTISFVASIGGGKYPICSILIFDNTPEVIDYIESGPLKKLDETENLIYVYTRASQYPIEYYENKNFKTIYDNVYNETSNVMNSFKLHSSVM
ncbi:hypothetical protein COF80_13275 [Bacillus toyonensis]|uniref:Uncharacterized protein n=1 Tax=Bacillus toyonensis TaxID=155322 RepID=A0AB73QUQ1_9BACI|nr:hypothetical protein [Bacillus toyonensis]PEI84408.1 hypothetical protein CN678_19815 [Bacillus toyonensis]PEK39538.1 hypothetical protein CN586_28590 [Bacillus toyonensis]PEM40128.1 hypothetical protein CN636_24440 [Bacillus toyonensis]PHE86134.1 hypothetical protein COF80_13275 [Bacillus toyonensis]